MKKSISATNGAFIIVLLCLGLVSLAGLLYTGYWHCLVLLLMCAVLVYAIYTDE